MSTTENLHPLPALNLGEAIATVHGVGTVYVVCYDHLGSRFVAGLGAAGHAGPPRSYPATFAGSFAECLVWVGNKVADEVQIETGATSGPDTDRLALVDIEGNVR